MANLVVLDPKRRGIEAEKLQTRLGNGTAIQGTTPETDPGSSVGLSYQFEY